MALPVLFRCAVAPEGGGRRPLPADLSSFERGKRAVFAAAGNTPAARRALPACDEALTNIVRYSGAGSSLPPIIISIGVSILLSDPRIGDPADQAFRRVPDVLPIRRFPFPGAAFQLIHDVFD